MDNYNPFFPAAAPVPAPVQTQGGVYEAGTPRDRLVWALETKKFVDEGNAIVHNADRLGGTVGRQALKEKGDRDPWQRS